MAQNLLRKRERTPADILDISHRKVPQRQRDIELYDEEEEDTAAEEESQETDAIMEESMDPLAESGRTAEGDSDEELDDTVLEDMQKFEETMEGISKRYRLINRIGEGTFSTVYKAEDLLYEHYQNDWDIEEKENGGWMSPHSQKQAASRRRPRYVAIKKIYVTSSPLRILNELELLHDLRNSDSVCPLITAFRHNDQVIAILPYFQHMDFREYFRDFSILDIRDYMRSLFTSLVAVHAHGILHRDIKPTNFLYYPRHRRGVLVDFGLAEREGTDYQPCPCEHNDTDRATLVRMSKYYQTHSSNTANQPPSYPNPKTDARPARRANRAGTRGFRAPEVLFKCTAQTPAIDVWSAGTILLTLLARRFPFFHSADDIDALIELSTIFGRRRMRDTALAHGQVFETNIPTIGENGIGLDKIVRWSTGRQTKDEKGRLVHDLSEDEKWGVEFLGRCFDLDPRRRVSAVEAMESEFLGGLLPCEMGVKEEEEEEEEMGGGVG